MLFIVSRRGKILGSSLNELLKVKELFKCWKKDIFQVNIQERLMEVKTNRIKY